MDNTNNLYSEDDEFAFPDTQEFPATFSRNIIRRLGIYLTAWVLMPSIQILTQV